MKALAAGLRIGLLAVGGAAGCAGTGFDLAALPPEPIAFVYRTSDQADRRAEILGQKESDAPARPGVKILHADRVRELLSDETQQDAFLRTLGTLSLLDPRTGAHSPLASAHAGDRALEWSPDHRRLRLLSFRYAKPQVLEYDLDAQELRQITRSQWTHLDASVAPDGRIAVARRIEEEGRTVGRIYVHPAEGGDARPVTPGPLDFAPQWSPDGGLLVYSTLQEPRGRAVAIVDPRSGEAPRILGPGKDPVFTPDGRWIVYSRKVRDKWRLWRMLPNGVGKQSLGQGPLREADELHPAVSPDGAFVVYVSEEAGRQKLRVRRIEGSGDRPLLEGGDGAFPVW